MAYVPKGTQDHYLPRGTLRREAAEHGIPMEGVEAFHEHRRSAKKRGLGFLFSLPEWWGWWQVDGRWAQRGRGKDKLVMARKGDAGPYSPENVYAATHTQNIGDVPAAVRQAACVLGIAAAAEANRLRRGAKSVRSKPVITPMGRFDCAADAARAHGLHPCYASKKALSGHGGWRYDVS